VAEKKKKKDNRGRHSKPPQWRGNIDPEHTKEVGNSLLYWYRLGQDRAVTDEEIAERLDHYFERCFTIGEIPLVETMALALGYSVETLRRWELGLDGSTPTRSVFIKRAKAMISSYDANMVTDGKINPVCYIFRSKNYYGMRDQVEHVVAPSDPLGALVDPDEIRERIEKQIPDPIEEE